jgi:hypothetical protein
MDQLRADQVDVRVHAVLAQLGEFFMGKSPVHQSALEIARHFEEAGIDYAIAGAVALGVHGFVRATEDVDVLVSREGLAQFKDQWLGRGYVDLRPGGKAVRDTIHNVKIDFLIAGDYPGDGLPKQVRFPDPASSSIRGKEFRLLSLERLVEIKLASGMTAAHRMQDLADVIQLIKRGRIPKEFVSQLDASVHAKFLELWDLAQRDDDY